jgi:L-amino acid N-acyltransferase YncA
MLSGVVIRPATRRDAEAIRAIYNAEIDEDTTFDMVPRSPEEQEAWLLEHSGAYPVLVAEDGGEVVGFGSLSRYKARPAYSTTVEDSVYVAGGHRGRGVGRALLAGLLDSALASGFHSVIARITATNQASIRLHQGCGFSLVGIERQVGRKRGRWLDVAVMQRLL